MDEQSPLQESNDTPRAERRITEPDPDWGPEGPHYPMDEAAADAHAVKDARATVDALTSGDRLASANARAAMGARVYPDPAAAPADSVRRRVSWLIILVPLFLCLVTSLLAVVIATPLRAQNQDDSAPQLPVTGGDPLQTPTPRARGQAQAPGPLIGQSYREVATDNLSTCLSSFHDFFLMEELASHQPDMLKNDTWQSDVTQAMTSFRDDCQKLGDLPDAPPGYVELDRWLKLAAAEVGPATDGFTTAMKSQQSSDLRGSIRHMLRFVEYTHNAETILSGMEQRREI